MEGTYTVEIREAIRGGDDYAERDEECDTPEEVREVIAEKDEDEYVFAVLFYKEGTDCDPRDVTRKFV